MGVPWIDGRAYGPNRSYGPDDLRSGEGQALPARLPADTAENGESIGS